jgi:hypothetical protein
VYFSSFRYVKRKLLPDDDPSWGKKRLAGGVILAVSESVSIHDRTAATGVDFIFGFAVFCEVVGVLRVGARRRKLTRFKNE